MFVYICWRFITNATLLIACEKICLLCSHHHASFASTQTKVPAVHITEHMTPIHYRHQTWIPQTNAQSHCEFCCKYHIFRGKRPSDRMQSFRFLIASEVFPVCIKPLLEAVTLKEIMKSICNQESFTKKYNNNNFPKTRGIFVFISTNLRLADDGRRKNNL